MKPILRHPSRRRAQILGVPLNLLVLIILPLIFGLKGCTGGQEEGLIQKFEYDEEGRLKLVLAPDGGKTQYEYNDKGLLTYVEYPHGEIRYGYDAGGNRTWMLDETGSTEYYYDAFDRLSAVLWQRLPQQLITYEYDPWDFITHMTIVNLGKLSEESGYRETVSTLLEETAAEVEDWKAREEQVQKLLTQLAQELPGRSQTWTDYEVKYTHDIQGNLTGLLTKSGAIQYTYNPDAGQIERRLPNGVVSHFEYSPSGQLTSLRHEESSGRVIAEYRYEYNSAGKIVQVQESTPQKGLQTTRYSWDERGYLQELQGPDGSRQRYEYDAMGNRILIEASGESQQYRYDAYDRLMQAGEVKCAWDKNGRLTSQTGEQGKTKIKYDGRGLPEQIKSPEGKAEYAWDGDGNLVYREFGDQTSRYLPNPLAPAGSALAQYDEEGTLTASFLYGDGLIGRQDANGQTSYFLEDGFTSARYRVDAQGAVVEEWEYSPFAEITSPGKEAAVEHFRMMGERYLPEMDAYLIGNRLYDPATGRFLAPDPDPGLIERPDSFNRYTHADPDWDDYMEPWCCQTLQDYSYDNPFGRLEIDRIPALEFQDLELEPIPPLPMPDIELNPTEPLSPIPGLDPRPVEIFIAGINTTPNQLNADRLKYGLGGTINTSWLGEKPSGLKTFRDMCRAGGNYLGWWGGKTKALNELRQYQDANPGRKLLIETHSNGAITTYNLRKALANDIKSGRLNISEIRIAGCGLANELQNYFNDEGVNVKVTEINPANRYSDFVTIMTTTQRELAREVGYPLNPIMGPLRSGFWIKAGAAANMAWSRGQTIGLKYHGLENYHGLFENEPQQPGQIGGRPRYTGPAAQEPDPRSLYLPERDDEIKRPPRGPFPPPPWWPDGGGGGGGGRPGGGSGGGGFYDPFRSVEPQLGGIEFKASAQFAGDLGRITGAVWDEAKGRLVLVGDQDLSVPSIREEDLAVALACVYGNQAQDPAFSLDPADPKNPEGKWLKCVYIPENILAGTDFGQAMLEADWLLKQYSFGIVVEEEGKAKTVRYAASADPSRPYIVGTNYRMHERISSVPGFKSVKDIDMEKSRRGEGENQWCRFWIVADDQDDDGEHNMTLRRSGDGKSIFFDKVAMKVMAKSQVPDPSSPSGLRDAESEDPTAVEFARLFTQLYDQLAQESPEFARMKELAKAVALAKWMKQQNIPVDMDWVNEHRYGSHISEEDSTKVSYTTTMPALSVTWRKDYETYYRKYYLFGGVDAAVTPLLAVEDQSAPVATHLQTSVTEKLDQASTGPLFWIENEEGSSLGAVLPVTVGGRQMWSNLTSLEVGGSIYQFNHQKKITSSEDKAGNLAQYGYDPSGALKSVQMTDQEGWKVAGERSAQGSSWNSTNPRGHTFGYQYDPTGLLSRVDIEGKAWASYQYDLAERQMQVLYPSGSAKMVYDEHGLLTEYVVTHSPSQSLSFGYDERGNLTRIAGDGVPSVNISYTEDGYRPAVISTPRSELFYTYDPAGKISQINSSTGMTAGYQYGDNQQLYKLQIQNQGAKAEYTFSDQGLIRARDLLGGVTDYAYTEANLSTVRQGQNGEASYVYDEKKRLKEIHLPNASWVEYVYFEEKSDKKEAKQEALQTVTVIVHPAGK